MKHLLNQSIIIYSGESYDDYGSVVVGSGTTAKARFSLTNRTLQLPHGEVAPIDAVVDIMGDVEIAQGDKITYDAQSYKVMKIKEAIGGGGAVHHKRLMVQVWTT